MSVWTLFFVLSVFKVDANCFKTKNEPLYLSSKLLTVNVFCVCTLPLYFFPYLCRGSVALCCKYQTSHCLTGILKWKWIGILEMQYCHTSILISHWRRLLIRCQKWQQKRLYFWFSFSFTEDLSLSLSLSFLSLYVQLKSFSLCRSVEIAMCHFWGLTIVFVYMMLYIAFWAIAACLWDPPSPKAFLFFCVN